MIHPHDWDALGLDAPTTDLAAVRRAYSVRLRVTRPDDDAAAYQRLREAYDRVVATLRAAPDGHDASSPRSVPRPLETAEPTHDVSASPLSSAEDLLDGAQDLLDNFHQRMEDEGEAAALAELPALLVALDRLPLLTGDDASARFADWVIAYRDLPPEVIAALREHFEWDRIDFRAANRLGWARVNALKEALARPPAEWRLRRPPPKPAPPPLPARTREDLRGLGHLLATGRLLRAWWASTLLSRLRPETLRRAGPDALAGLDIPSHLWKHVEGCLAFGTATRWLAVATTAILLFGLGNEPRATALGAGLMAMLLAWIVERLLDVAITLSPLPRRRGPEATLWGLGLLLLSAAFAMFAEASDQPGAMFVPILCAVAGALLATPRRPDEGIALMMCAMYPACVVPGWPAPLLLLIAAWVIGAAHLADGPLPAAWHAAWQRGAWRTRLQVALRAAPSAIPLAAVALVRRRGTAPFRWAAMLALILHGVVPEHAATTGWRVTWMAALLLAFVALGEAGERFARRLMPDRA